MGVQLRTSDMNRQVVMVDHLGRDKLDPSRTRRNDDFID